MQFRKIICGALTVAVVTAFLGEPEPPEVTCLSNKTVQTNKPKITLTDDDVDIKGYFGGEVKLSMNPELDGTNTLKVGLNEIKVTAAAKETDFTDTCTFYVIVEDITPPVVTCPANTSVTTRTPGLALTGQASATDNFEGVVTISYNPCLDGIHSLNTGSNEIEVTATDASGNNATCTFVVDVTGTCDGELNGLTLVDGCLVSCAVWDNCLSGQLCGMDKDCVSPNDICTNTCQDCHNPLKPNRCKEGATCTFNNQCASSVCIGGRCLANCYDDNVCGLGQPCDDGDAATNDDENCKEKNHSCKLVADESGVAKKTCQQGNPKCTENCKLGEACERYDQCQSKQCINGTCEKPCGADNLCEEGWHCTKDEDCHIDLNCFLQSKGIKYQTCRPCIETGDKLCRPGAACKNQECLDGYECINEKCEIEIDP